LKLDIYNRYISSIFQLEGYFTERRVVKKEEEKILEFDIILTDYRKVNCSLIMENII